MRINLEKYLIIIVDVKTGAKKEMVMKMREDRYNVSVKETRRRGQANAAVLKALQKYFGKRARIIRGFTSKRKIIEIED